MLTQSTRAAKLTTTPTKEPPLNTTAANGNDMNTETISHDEHGNEIRTTGLVRLVTWRDSEGTTFYSVFQGNRAERKYTTLKGAERSYNTAVAAENVWRDIHGNVPTAAEAAALMRLVAEDGGPFAVAQEALNTVPNAVRYTIVRMGWIRQGRMTNLGSMALAASTLAA